MWNGSNWWTCRLPIKHRGKGEGKARLCCSPTEDGLDLRKSSPGSAALSSLSSWALASALLACKHDRDLEYVVDSKTETLLICITSHMLCCKNFHCACFRIELTLHTEYFSFTQKETSQKEEFMWLWNDSWSWSLNEMNHWRLLFFVAFWNLFPWIYILKACKAGWGFVSCGACLRRDREPSCWLVTFLWCWICHLCFSVSNAQPRIA